MAEAEMAPGDTIASVAKRAGISEQQLREANRVPPRYRLAAGSTILIPRDETMDVDIPAESLDARFALVPEQSNLCKVTYRVRRGDTLHAVARKWNVDEKDVIVWNHLTAPTLFAGQRLELTVAAPKARAAKTGVAKASTGKKSAAASAPKASAAAKAPGEGVPHEVGRQAGGARGGAFRGARSIKAAAMPGDVLRHR